MIELEKITEQPLAEQIKDNASLLIVQSEENENNETQEQIQRAATDLLIKYFGIPTNLKNGLSDGALETITSKVLSEFSVALGKNLIVGQMCYYIKSIDTEQKKIYLTDTKQAPYISSDDNTDISFETPAYDVGDEFSMIIGIGVNHRTHYHFMAKIVSISNNVVEYDKDLPFATIYENDAHTTPTFFVPSKPLVGTHNLTIAGFSSGEDCISAGENSTSGGYGCISGGNYGLAIGRENKAGYAAAALCWQTFAPGIGAFSVGHRTQAIADESFAEGVGTIAMSDGQHVAGKYNIEDLIGEFAYILGNGTGSKRSNAHTIDWDGNAWFSGNVTVGENKDKLVSAKDMDEIISSIMGTYTLKNLVAGITSELKLSLYYDIDFDEYAVFIGDNEFSRALKGESIKVASETLGADKTCIVFYSNGEEIIRAKTKPTIKNCGMLFAEYEEE